MKYGFLFMSFLMLGFGCAANAPDPEPAEAGDDDDSAGNYDNLPEDVAEALADLEERLQDQITELEERVNELEQWQGYAQNGLTEYFEINRPELTTGCVLLDGSGEEYNYLSTGIMIQNPMMVIEKFDEIDFAPWSGPFTVYEFDDCPSDSQEYSSAFDVVVFGGEVHVAEEHQNYPDWQDAELMFIKASPTPFETL